MSLTYQHTSCVLGFMESESIHNPHSHTDTGHQLVCTNHAVPAPIVSVLQVPLRPFNIIPLLHAGSMSTGSVALSIILFPYKFPGEHGQNMGSPNGPQDVLFLGTKEAQQLEPIIVASRCSLLAR